MSSNSGSSRHRSHRSRANGSNTEDLIEQVKGVVTQLYDVASSRPHQWQTYLASARSAVVALERIQFFRDPDRFAEQVWVLNGLQEYAFHDPDSGTIADIATFCQTSWLLVLRNFPDNVEALSGLGYNWLQQAQATLARIHSEENAGTSSSGSSQGASPVDIRLQGQLYVEARSYLQPAVDFYVRAVRSADALGNTTGDLLAAAAQSQMSLGNVTASPGDEPHFTRAIRYLRRATAIPGYTLSTYLQGYLDEYGRYIT